MNRIFTAPTLTGLLVGVPTMTAADPGCRH